MRKLLPRLVWLTLAALVVMSGGGVGASHQTTIQPARPTLLTDPVPDPKQAGVRWFEPTGHTLRGAFLDYWTRYGGLEQFGYPLTEEFFEPVGPENKQHRVQYFERARFEHHPENAGTPYEVLLGTLGREFRQQDPPSTPAPNATYFRETGHNLSGAFKAYWEAHGGLFVHGFPITEALMERSTDGKEYLVQWFERSRFELHPQNKPPYDVLLGLLGRQLFEKKGYPYGWYPLYGHAVDYSWVAGVYTYFPEIFLGNIHNTCAIMNLRPLRRSDGSDERIQLVQSDGTPYLPPTKKIYDDLPLVAFGGFSPDGFRGTRCTSLLQTRLYIFTAVQENTVR
jgi:hypothetical protein